MVDYFELVSKELLNKLDQIRQFVKRHNPTIGVLTEEILRSFLKAYLPKSVSVEQGFILSKEGNISKQCDILIYDSYLFAPFYRINDIVIVPYDSVIAVIEVKTTLTKSIFHNVINYFENISFITEARKYLFIYNSCDINNLDMYFRSFKHKGDYQQFDHDTFLFLPDEITGLNNSYHLSKDSVNGDRDEIGYSSYFFNNEKGTEINALQNFYISVYSLIEAYNYRYRNVDELPIKRDEFYKKGELNKYFAFGLFDM